MPTPLRHRGAVFNPQGLKATLVANSAHLQRGASTLKEFEEDDDEDEDGGGAPSTVKGPEAIKSQWTSPGSILSHPSRFSKIVQGSPAARPQSSSSFASFPPASAHPSQSQSALDRFQSEARAFHAAPPPPRVLASGFLSRLLAKIYRPSAPLTASEVLTLKVFSLLGLTSSELSKLRDVFKSIDEDGSGKISYDEFLQYTDIESTDFLRKVFLAMDSDGSGTMDLREFIVNLWNYCSLEKSGLILFAYDLYDADKNGTLSEDEVKAMFLQVFGKEFAKSRIGDSVLNNLQSYVSQRESDFGAIGKPDFVRLVEDHPNVLLPAFHVQMALRSNLCGTSFWQKITARRSKAILDGNDPWHQISALSGSGKVAKKVDAKQVLKKYQKNVAEQAMQELRNDYKRKLIGRLGEYNPDLNGDKRNERYSRLKSRTLDLFEDLNCLHEESMLPRVLTAPKTLTQNGPVTSLEVPVAKCHNARKGNWQRGVDFRPKEDIDKDVNAVRDWYGKVSEALAEEDLLNRQGGLADVKAGTIGYTLKECVVGPKGRQFNMDSIVDVRKLTIFN